MDSSSSGSSSCSSSSTGIAIIMAMVDSTYEDRRLYYDTYRGVWIGVAALLGLLSILQLTTHYRQCPCGRRYVPAVMAGSVPAALIETNGSHSVPPIKRIFHWTSFLVTLCEACLAPDPSFVRGTLPFWIYTAMVNQIVILFFCTLLSWFIASLSLIYRDAGQRVPLWVASAFKIILLTLEILMIVKAVIMACVQWLMFEALYECVAAACGILFICLQANFLYRARRALDIAQKRNNGKITVPAPIMANVPANPPAPAASIGGNSSVGSTNGSTNGMMALSPGPRSRTPQQQPLPMSSSYVGSTWPPVSSHNGNTISGIDDGETLDHIHMGSMAEGSVNGSTAHQNYQPQAAASSTGVGVGNGGSEVREHRSGSFGSSHQPPPFNSGNGGNNNNGGSGRGTPVLTSLNAIPALPPASHSSNKYRMHAAVASVAAVSSHDASIPPPLPNIIAGNHHTGAGTGGVTSTNGSVDRHASFVSMTTHRSSRNIARDNAMFTRAGRRLILFTFITSLPLGYFVYSNVSTAIDIFSHRMYEAPRSKVETFIYGQILMFIVHMAILVYSWVPLLPRSVRTLKITRGPSTVMAVVTKPSSTNKLTSPTIGSRTVYNTNNNNSNNNLATPAHRHVYGTNNNNNNHTMTAAAAMAHAAALGSPITSGTQRLGAASPIALSYIDMNGGSSNGNSQPGSRASSATPTPSSSLPPLRLPSMITAVTAPNSKSPAAAGMLAHNNSSNTGTTTPPPHHQHTLHNYSSVHHSGPNTGHRSVVHHVTMTGSNGNSPYHQPLQGTHVHVHAPLSPPLPSASASLSIAVSPISRNHDGTMSPPPLSSQVSIGETGPPNSPMTDIIMDGSQMVPAIATISHSSPVLPTSMTGGIHGVQQATILPPPPITLISPLTPIHVDDPYHPQPFAHGGGHQGHHPNHDHEHQQQLQQYGAPSPPDDGHHHHLPRVASTISDDERDGRSPSIGDGSDRNVFENNEYTHAPKRPSIVPPLRFPVK